MGRRFKSGPRYSTESPVSRSSSAYPGRSRVRPRDAGFWRSPTPKLRGSPHAPPPQSVPTYRLHKPTGQAYVRVPDGRRRPHDVYLGPYDSPESRRVRPARRRAAAPPPGRPRPPHDGRRHCRPWPRCCWPSWRHAERHYRRPDGTPTNELDEYRLVVRAVRELYGHTPAAEFGPLALKAVRQADGRRRAGRGAGQPPGRPGPPGVQVGGRRGTGPVAVYQALTAVAGLQKGRTAAREPEPVGPVADADVAATLPYLRPHVAADGRVPAADRDAAGRGVSAPAGRHRPAGPVWLYRPPQHKTPTGARRGWSPSGRRPRRCSRGSARRRRRDYFFSPRRAVEALHAERSAKRVTPRYPSHMRRNAGEAGEAKPQRPPAERYTARATATRSPGRRAGERRPGPARRRRRAPRAEPARGPALAPEPAPARPRHRGPQAVRAGGGPGGARATPGRT